jgi:hypothetical protein
MYFLTKKRSKTLTIFKTFKEMENNDVGQKIKILKND